MVEPISDCDLAKLRRAARTRIGHTSTVTIRGLLARIDNAETERDELAGRIVAALAEHPADSPRLGNAFCVPCDVPYPCPTREALEGTP